MSQLYFYVSNHQVTGLFLSGQIMLSRCLRGLVGGSQSHEGQVETVENCLVSCMARGYCTYRRYRCSSLLIAPLSFPSIFPILFVAATINATKFGFCHHTPTPINRACTCLFLIPVIVAWCTRSTYKTYIYIIPSHNLDCTTCNSLLKCGLGLFLCQILFEAGC